MANRTIRAVAVHFTRYESMACKRQRLIKLNRGNLNLGDVHDFMRFFFKGIISSPDFSQTPVVVDARRHAINFWLTYFN